MESKMIEANSASSCGSASCGCSGGAAVVEAAAVTVPIATVNGVALYEPGDVLDSEQLRERAYAELLRQEAVRRGLLPVVPDMYAIELADGQRKVIEKMLDDDLVVPEADDDACRRYYTAHKRLFVVGQALHLRHILFAVTPGINVQALAQRAEKILLELSGKSAQPERFAQMAKQFSNCPSGAQDGELGWVGRIDCAPELARELFFASETVWPLGLHPRLVHTRHGLHIIEVLERREGRQQPYEEARAQIVMRLDAQARATALNRMMRDLVAAARIEGVELEG